MIPKCSVYHKNPIPFNKSYFWRHRAINDPSLRVPTFLKMLKVEMTISLGV